MPLILVTAAMVLFANKQPADVSGRLAAWCVETGDVVDVATPNEVECIADGAYVRRYTIFSVAGGTEVQVNDYVDGQLITRANSLVADQDSLDYLASRP